MTTQTSLTACVRALVVASVLVGPLLAEDVELGDDIAVVIQRLGKPRGRMSGGRSEIILYDRGTVSFIDGKVTSFRLVSPEEAEERKAERRRWEAAHRAAVAAARRQRIRDGHAERERVEGDASFEERSLEEQLSFWRGFQRRYPEVSVYGRIGELERKLRAGAEKRQQAELAALSSKIAETEARISEIANRSGMGRRALIYARRELAQLRETLPKLEKQREELLRSAP
jgi:hypothetical protein